MFRAIIPIFFMPLLAFAQGSDRDPAGKLHPYLREQLAASDTKAPVYFVMREKLPYEHFFPRVWRLDKETRRATVVRELKDHMYRTQRELFAYLEREAAKG